MRVRTRWTVALAGAAALAGPLAARSEMAAAVAPQIKQSVAIKAAPVNAVPDSGESDSSGVGPEAREAMASPAEVGQVMAGSLDAQYAALQQGPLAVAAVPMAAPAAVISTPAVATMAAPAQLLPAVATLPEPAATPLLPSVQAAAPPSSGPSVALARRVVESAEAFAAYMSRASAVRPDYADAAGVAKAVAAGGVYEAGQLDEGAIAYVALVALQDQEFVRAVDALGGQGYRAQVVQALSASPRAIMQMPSSAAAAARAAKALGRMGAALQVSGAAVKQSAYDIQHSAWSKAPVATPAAMLAELKARSRLREAMALDGGQAMLSTLTQLRSVDTEGGSGRLTPVVAQGLTLAALAVLGEAGEEHADRVANLLNDAESAQCLKMARLNLYQCLSVAGPNYEDVFCLGQHAMMDTAQCVANASGWAAPSQGVSIPVARPGTASIMVPVALNGASDAGAGGIQALEPAAAAPGDPNDFTPAGAPPPMATPVAYPTQPWGAGQR